MLRAFAIAVALGLTAWPPAAARAQTADELSALIKRLLDLDSIDIAKDVKFRPGLEPALHELDADESGMKILADPYEVHGRNKPGAAGWYRVTFTAPEMIGKIALPKTGYNLGVESNVLGAWEIYTYNNGKPVGTSMATGVRGAWSEGNLQANSRQPASAWMSNAPIPTKPGDRITVAILATAAPLGRGSPEGFGLRFLRLRFALSHTLARQPFYGSVASPNGPGTGLHGAREMLATLKGDELKALQELLAGPVARLEAVFEAGNSGQLDKLSKAMAAAKDEINAALKKKPPTAK